jgi:ribosomal protein S13
MGGPGPPADATVSVPITVRVRGKQIDVDRLGTIVEDRAGRQLDRANDALGDQRIQADVAITFRYTGEAQKLSADDKQAVETAIQKGLISAAKTTQQKRPGKNAGAAKQADTQAGKPAKAEKAKPEARSVPPIAQWHVFSQIGDDDFNAALMLAFIDAFPQGQPEAYGILFRLGGQVVLLIVVNDKYAVNFPLMDPNYTGGPDTPTSLKATGQYTLELVPDGLAVWRDLSRATARDQVGGTEHKGKKSHQADVNKPDQQLDIEADKRTMAYSKGWEETMGAFYKLRAKGSKWHLLPFLKADANAIGNRTPIPVVCLVDYVTPEEADEIDEGLIEDGAGERYKLPEGGGGGGTGQGQGGQQGDGDGGGGDGLGSDVREVPAEGMKGGRGVVIAPEYKEGASIFPTNPPDPNAKIVEITCKQYDGEPAVDELGAVGDEMRALIAEIAARLDMPICQYPANFCINAAKMLAVRASQVATRFQYQDKGFFEEIVVGTVDGSGSFSFRPLPSVAIQYLQHIAATVPRLRKLIDLVVEYSAKRMSYSGWAFHFFEKVADEAFPACARIYYYANQIIMAQLLNTSMAAIEQRQQKIDDYIRVFAVLVKSQLADQVELVMLRDALLTHKKIVGDRRGDAAKNAVQLHYQLKFAIGGNPSDWATYIANADSEDLVLRLADRTEFVFGRANRQEKKTVGTGAIIETEDGQWSIRASDGTLYTTDTLEQLITVGQQMVTQIDPLISQLLHRFVSAIRPLAEDPSKIPAFVTGLLAEMAAKNREVARKNLGDVKYAFEHGQIHKVSYDADAPPMMRTPTLPGGRFILSGIHAMAHELVGTSFADDRFYRAALDSMLGRELGWKELKSDLVFFGGIVLTVICPPLGAAFSFVAGLAVAISDYRHAKEQEQIFGALINPDQVLNYAEIQIELFVAKLGIALSFLSLIPDGYAAVKGISSAAKRVLAKEVQVTAKSIAKELIEAQLKRLEEVCAKGFAIAFAQEVASQEIQGKIIEKLLSPIIDAQIADLEKELQAEGAL